MEVTKLASVELWQRVKKNFGIAGLFRGKYKGMNNIDTNPKRICQRVAEVPIEALK